MKGFAHDIFERRVAARLRQPLVPVRLPRRHVEALPLEFSTIQFVSRQFEDTPTKAAQGAPEVSNLNRFWRPMASFPVRRRKDDIYEFRRRSGGSSSSTWTADTRVFTPRRRMGAERDREGAPRIRRQPEHGHHLGRPLKPGTPPRAQWRVTTSIAACLEAETWNKLEKIREPVRRADRGEKTIIFSGLRVMVAAIVRHLRQHGSPCSLITAECAGEEALRAHSGVLASPDVCAIVASLNCLNRGFTITAANHVILVDLEYSPEATEQAEDRVHRPGQTKPVSISYLLSCDTIDQVMHEILIQKAEAIRHAIDGKARFEDVAEILKRVTGDVQLEIAKRIQLLPCSRRTSPAAAQRHPIIVPELPRTSRSTNASIVHPDPRDREAALLFGL
jgi:hypothetical protein